MQFLFALMWLLTLATSVSAEGVWVLWARPCDLKAQTCAGEWQRRQVFDAERWCKAAQTAAVNQALTLEGIRASWRKGIIVEYQCLPDTVDPRGPKAK